MKRKLFCFITSIILIVACVFSVGCSKLNTLEFFGYYAGYSETKDALGGYSETLSYKVSESNNYDGNYSINNDIDENIFKVSYKNGSYVSTLKVHGTVPSGAPDEVKNSNIIPLLEGSPIYQLDTTLSIDVCYSINGEQETTNTDTVKTTSYFCPAKFFFAPIYSYTHSVNTMFSVGTVASAVAVRELTNTVCYNKSSFVSKTIENGEEKTINGKYDFKTIIDNTQLLFAIRNMSLSSEASALPVMQFSYNRPTTLSVSNKSTSDVSLTINDYKNQGEKTDTTSIKNVAFIVADTTAPGMYQFAEIQNAKSKNEVFASNALLTTYAHTLYASGTAGYYRVLVYTLESVSVVEPN